MRPFSILLVLLLTGARQQQDVFPQTITLDGRLTRADYERVLERTFEVPAGVRRIEIDYLVSGADRRTVVDLGLRGPSGLRGWSGGGKRSVFVSALGATPGYLPGPLEAGQWAVILGVPNIREGSQDAYTVTIRMFDTDLPTAGRVIRAQPGWYAGDLHAHSGHSDGRSLSRSGVAIPTPVHRVFDAAVAAGLDFVALSDHNTASHWLDVDRLQPHYDSLLLLHGREVTTYRGHANTVGETSFNEFRLPSPSASPAGLLATIAASGAFISINHPLRPDDETCMGCGWNVDSADTIRQLHGVEVINGALRGGSMDGWPFWARLLNRGDRLTGVGGSDEHTVDAPQDQNLGTPTTVVFARELSEAGIVEGLKSGRVYIRTRNPKGPALALLAESAGETFEMGEVIPTPATPLTLIVELERAEGQIIEWVRNGEPFASDPVTAGARRRVVNAHAGDWFSVVVRDTAGQPTVVSNAIYVGRSRQPL